MNCSIDQSLCCIVQAQSAIFQAFSNIITTNLIPNISALPNTTEKSCLTTMLMNSNANHVCATSHLIKSVAYYQSVTNPPKICSDTATTIAYTDSTLPNTNSETCFPTQANAYGKCSTTNI